jgi:SAM-dependent methyltransferase
VTGDLYSHSFFSAIGAGSERSAKNIVPIVMGLVRPTSVVDVGCGTGAFLSCFKEHGVRRVLGIDGEWAKPTLTPDEFQVADLSKPLAIGTRFDLVVSLEVAEHLEPSSATGFVRSLTALGPIVLFSAAVPHQGGTGHLNEQWPDYWANLFSDAGFELVDCLRMRLWDNSDVNWWYSQNSFLYVERARLASFRAECPELVAMGPVSLRLPHPQNYLNQVALRDRQYWSSWSTERIKRAIVRRLAKYTRFLRTGGNVPPGRSSSSE